MHIDTRGRAVVLSHGAIRVICALLVGTVCAVALISCTPGSGFTVRIDAIRATAELKDPVALSVWLYEAEKNEELVKTFRSGRISGTGWVEFASSDTVEIPASAVAEDGTFAFRIELNPNRLATPPDAVFRGAVPVSEVVALSGGAEAEIVVRAVNNAPFAVRLVFGKTGS